jgi:hypothetical protein
MSKEITKKFPKTISISEYESIRCSRDCNYCSKQYGTYRCFIRDYEDGEEIELLDDVDDDNFSSADTYRFKRTEFCLKNFGE